MKTTLKSTVALLLALVLVFSLALPAFAFSYGDEGDGFASFGIANGYVRTKANQKDSEGGTHVAVWTYNEQGKLLKKTDTSKGPEGTYRMTLKNTYDKKGNLTKEVFNDNGTVLASTHTYDKKGNVIKSVQKTTNPDGTVFSSTTVYTYDKQNRLTKQVDDFGFSVRTRTYAFDKAGKLTKETDVTVDEDNTRTSETTTHTYDEAGHEITLAVVSKSSLTGSGKRTLTSVYNSKGQLVKHTEVDTRYGQTDREVTTYTYDKKGNKTKEVIQSTYGDGTKESRTITSTYDDKGRLTKEVYADKTQWGAAKNTYVYAYDSKGRTTKMTHTYQSGDDESKSTETYTYNKAGNLIKTVESISDGDYTGKVVTTYTYQKIGA